MSVVASGTVRPAGPIAPALVAASLALSLGPGAPAAAGVVARQGGLSLPLAPIEDPRSGTAYYAYNTTAASSAATGLETGNTSLLFLYHQLGAPNNNLFVIHDLPNDADGGATSFTFDGLPPGTVVDVRDDVPDGYAPDPPTAGRLVADWTWSPCCTDGLTLQVPGDTSYCVSIQPGFSSGISAWHLMSGPGLPPSRTPLPSLTEPVYLCADCQTLGCPNRVEVDCGGAGGADVTLVAFGWGLCPGATIVNDHNAGGADASGVYPIGSTVVTFRMTDQPGFTSTCQTTVVVNAGADPIPPDQGNVLKGVKQGADAGWDFTGAPAAEWRLYDDADKRALGTTALAPDVTVPSFRHLNAVPDPPLLGYYRLRGLSPCSHTPGP